MYVPNNLVFLLQALTVQMAKWVIFFFFEKPPTSSLNLMKIGPQFGQHTFLHKSGGASLLVKCQTDI